MNTPYLLSPQAIAPDTVHQLDYRLLLNALHAESVDAIITDPPYGMRLDTWDLPIDIPAFLSASYRVLKPNSFLAFTIQMPYMTDWLLALRDTKFRYKDHVVWVKRTHTNAATELCRSHESLLIYTKGQARYFETKGRWEDVKLPGFAFALLTIDAIDRYVKDLRLKLKSKSSIRRSGSNHHKVYEFMGYQEGDRSPEFANFTSVWSFLPENLAKRGNNITSGHASVKPLKMFERLVELLTPADYCDVARRRLAQPFTPNMFDTLLVASE